MGRAASEQAHSAPQAPVGPAAGLAYISTSDTQAVDDVEARLYTVDTDEGRDRRMRCSVITSSRLMHEQCAASGYRYRAWFVLLTYRGVDDWRPGHFTEYVKRVRAWAARRGVALRYVFKAELQQRGAVHYHVMFWLPKSLALPKSDKQGWWTHGHTGTQIARNPVGYIAKYAAKPTPAGHRFPRGCRMHGAGGLGRSQRLERRYWLAPTWAKTVFSMGENFCRATGGGFVSRDTGVHVPSPYRVVARSPGRVVLLRVIE